MTVQTIQPVWSTAMRPVEWRPRGYVRTPEVGVEVEVRALPQRTRTRTPRLTRALRSVERRIGGLRRRRPPLEREAQRTTRQNDGFRRDPVRTERHNVGENTSGGFAKGGSAAQLVCSACDRTTLLVVR